MLFNRDQFTNCPVEVPDKALVTTRHERREASHPHLSVKQDAHPPTGCEADIGDIVYINTDRTKHHPRDRYLVVG